MWGAVLPSRVVYLIQEGSTAGFRQAVQAASSRWGGVSELIVEVNPQLGVSDQNHVLVNLAQLEAAVSVDVPQDIAASAARAMGLPWVDFPQLETSQASRYSYPLPAFAGGDTFLVAQEQGPLWQVAVAGDTTPSQHHRPSVRRALDGSEIGLMQDRWSATLLEGSSWQFQEHHTASVENTSAVIWITDDEAPLADCLEFWNMRALRPRQQATRIPLVLLPHRDVEAWHLFDERVRNNLARPGERNVDVVLRSRSVEEAELHRLAELWGLQQQTEDQIIFGLPAPWEHAPPRTPPFTYKVNLDPSPWLAVQRDWGLRQDFDVHAFTDRPTGVRFRSPVRVNQTAAVLVRLAGEALAGLPRHASVAERIHPGAQWRGEQLQVGVFTEGDIVLELSIPSLENATVHLLNQLTQRWELSDKGQIGTALLAQNTAQALLLPHRYNLTMELFTPRSKELHKRLRQAVAEGGDDAELLKLAHNWGGRARRRYRKASNIGMANASAVEAAEHLCALGWVERGFETDCPRCGFKTFVPLAATTPDAACPGCASPSHYTSNEQGPVVHYRLDTFIDQAADQGVLPHLMAIARLEQLEPHSHLIPGANLYLDGHDQREADVIGTYNGRLLVGEVKTSPGDFTDEQISHDTSISAAVGANIHLMASVHPISENSRALAQRACLAHRMELIVLDNLRALQPPNNMDKAGR